MVAIVRPAGLGAFIYETACKTATIVQSTVLSSHSVKKGGILWLQSLGVQTFRYIAVTSAKDLLKDLPFPNAWNSAGGPSIPDKFLVLHGYPRSHS
jgi:hypothetical protein